jgi:hypothetical protein
MNWMIYFTECAACLVIFTLAILIPLIKNPVWWIHDYPEDIQEKYFETHDRIPSKPLSKPAIIKKGVALLLCLVLLTGLMVLAGARGFIPASRDGANGQGVPPEKVSFFPFLHRDDSGDCFLYALRGNSGTYVLKKELYEKSI